MNNNDKNDKSLVIVESPAKARTINRYLGEGYKVQASMGHVRDLPKKELGIDIENDFQPTYQVLPSRRKLVNQLKKLAKSAEQVYLATDLDREGEAIAWHLTEALHIPPEKAKRVIFNEITSRAITEAFKHPQGIDADKVNAQQARRILDRLVGYKISPLLWKKVAPGLSAGRVQSVAVRLIVEREQQIRAFKPEEYWKITNIFTTETDPQPAQQAIQRTRAKAAPAAPTKAVLNKLFRRYNLFEAELVRFGQEKFRPASGQQAEQVAELLRDADYTITSVKVRQRLDRPAGPFTTATMQQQASIRLRFPAAKTMRIAQQLYEGAELGQTGSVGLITYMRTDSMHIAQEALIQTRKFISKELGDEYLPPKPNIYSPSSHAQLAHEAIRPTDVTREPEQVKPYLSNDQYKLYDLIWRRFVASQCAPATWGITDVEITAEPRRDQRKGLLRCSGRQLLFDGYLRMWPEKLENGEVVLPPLSEQQRPTLVECKASQHFTAPPPRFTEASLVRELEKEGIGRPSTYATIIDTIQKRGYVEQIDRRFHATALGELVTAKLVEHFPKIMDVEFTRHMEELLDKIEESHLDWIQVLREFYDAFRESLERAHEQMVHAKAAVEPSEYKCPTCGKDMVYRWGKNGRFLACSDWPDDCPTTQNVDRQGRPTITKQTDIPCPTCGKPMVLRHSKHGPFLGCSDYPQCKTTLPCDEEGRPLKPITDEDIDAVCEKCGAPMKLRRKGQQGFLGCSNYPKCDFTAPLPAGYYLPPEKKKPPEPTGILCEKCGKEMVVRTGRRGRFLACSGFPKCRNTKSIDALAVAAPDRKNNDSEEK